MAERRMFTKKITDADEFISLPSSTQALYLHLTMSADDDGFNNQVQMAMFKAHASVDDLRVLLAKRFIIQFSNGVIVIKHWRMANALRKDRYTATAYQEELKMLKIKDNGAYALIDNAMVADWLPDGCQTVAADKISIEEDRVDKDSVEDIKSVSDKSDTLSVRTDIERIVAMWNELDGIGDIKGIRGIGERGDRKRLTTARLKEYGLDGFRNAIDRIKASDFLQGKHNGNPWVITYDWLIKPNNFPKVLEGNYDNKECGSQNGKDWWK